MLACALADLRYRLRALVARPVVERELEDELRFHLDREAEQNERRGLPRRHRRRAARLLAAVDDAGDDRSAAATARRSCLVVGADDGAAQARRDARAGAARGQSGRDEFDPLTQRRDRRADDERGDRELLASEASGERVADGSVAA